MFKSIKYILPVFLCVKWIFNTGVSNFLQVDASTIAFLIKHFISQSILSIFIKIDKI